MPAAMGTDYYEANLLTGRQNVCSFLVPAQTQPLLELPASIVAGDVQRHSRGGAFEVLDADELSPCDIMGSLLRVLQGLKGTASTAAEQFVGAKLSGTTTQRNAAPWFTSLIRTLPYSFFILALYTFV